MLVTGGSRGVGAAVVRQVVEAGADVIIHYGQSRERHKNLRLKLGEDRCLTVTSDFAAPDASSRLWQSALEWKGRIDVLVNNAGVYLAAGVDATEELWHETWATTLQVNLVAAGDLCRFAVKHFRDLGGGIIINITSRAAHRGDHHDYLHYTASKGGLSSMTRALARGFAPDNVLVYAVAPGWIQTEMIEDYVAEYGIEAGDFRHSPGGDHPARGCRPGGCLSRHWARPARDRDDHRCERRILCALALPDERISQHPDPRDLDLHHIARLEVR